MHKSRLPRSQQQRLMEHFVAGTTARTAGVLVGVNKTTAAYYFHRLRQLIYQASEDATPFSGEVEVDESYFGGRRKGLRGRGAAGKVPVFGLLKRGGKVYAKMISDIRISTLQAIIEEKIVPAASSIPIPSPPTMFWMFRSSSTTGSTMRNCSLIARITSTASRISGTRPSGICAVSMAFPKSTYLSFSRNANGGSTTQTRKINYYS